METKLINAETAKKELARFVGYLDEDTILRLQIALGKLPAVDAIPIEWLKANYPIHGVAGTESYFRKAYAVQEVLKAWELQKDSKAGFCGECDELYGDCAGCGEISDGEKDGRLINRADAMHAILNVDNYGDGIAAEVLEHARVEIALLPTVDAEPVIRCKDCRAWDREKENGRGGCFCWNTDTFTGSQDFCSSGARRDDEHKG